jgi:hypothetical protein
MIFLKENWNIDKIAKASIITMMLALIRCILEIFRLQYIHEDAEIGNLRFIVIQPFLIGALACSVSTLIMIVLHFYSKFKLVIVISIVTIFFLLYLKFFYVYNF